jgi:poly-gamma-glutamate synthesis protein (capsule biosynthesis protein)
MSHLKNESAKIQPPFGIRKNFHIYFFLEWLFSEKYPVNLQPRRKTFNTDKSHTMLRTIILSAVFFSACTMKQEAAPPSILENDTVLSLIFAGDIMGHSPQFRAAYDSKTKTYNYDACFRHVRKYIDSADIAVANLEVPIAGAPYSGYPRFSSPDALLDALKNAGYDVLLTANNHAVDRGKKGLERTVRQLQQRNLLHAGSYFDRAQRDSLYPLMIERKGVRLALLNCTYGTNGIPVAFPNIVNLIDTVLIKQDIQNACDRGADLKIMAVHWGEEYQLKANSEQEKLMDFFVRNGINAVIGTHPHVVQNAGIRYGEDSIPVPVYYSLGNAVSNQRKPHTNGGIMVWLTVNIRTKRIEQSSYLPVYVHKGVLDGIYQYHLIPTPACNYQPPEFILNRADSAALHFFDRETRRRLDNCRLMEPLNCTPHHSSFNSSIHWPVR